MRKRALVKKAAVVACSVALVANPAVAIAADGVSTQSVGLVATQANAQSWDVHNYDSTYTEALLLISLRDWWPKGRSYYDYYRLTSSLGAQYAASTNDGVLALSSGSYIVEGGDDRLIGSTKWTNLGTFTLNRWWHFGCTVVGSPIGANGSTVGGVTVSQSNGEDFTFYNTGNGKIDEGVTLTVKPIQIPGYSVSVMLDNNPVTLDENGTFTIAGRSGQDGMFDSRVTVTYAKTVNFEADHVVVSYVPSKQATLEDILAACVSENKARLYDPATHEQITGLTTADFSVSSDEDELNAGDHQITLSYKGTVGGQASEYAAADRTFTITVSPVTLAPSWAQQLDAAPTGAAYDGVISYDAAQTFDFGVAENSGAPVTFKTTFYNGMGDSKTLLGEDYPTEPGLYTQVVELVDQSGNYAADTLTRTFVIDPVPTSIVFDEEDVHVTYDGAAHALETAHARRGDEDVPQGSITYRYVRYEEGEEVYDSAAAPTDAGEYTVIATYWDETGYYAMSEATATLTIDPRAISVKVDSLKKTEGEVDPKLTFSVIEGADGWAGVDSLVDTLKVTLTRDAGEAPGEYVIVFMAENGSNFEITVAPGTFTIEKKATDPGKPGSGNAEPAAKPASKKDKKAALPQTGDAFSAAAPLATGAAGVAALATAIARKRRNN